MSGSPVSIESLAALCQQHAAEIAKWLGPFFDEPIDLAAEDHQDLVNPADLEELSGAGLALPLRGEGAAALLIIPAGAVPLAPWTRESHQVASRSASLVRDFRNLLFPDQVAVSAKAIWIDNLAVALAQCGMSNGSQRVPLRVTAAGNTSLCSLLWPCPQIDQLTTAGTTAPERAHDDLATDRLTTPESVGAESPLVASTAASVPPSTTDEASTAPSQAELALSPERAAHARPRLEYRDLDDGLRRLPAYARSLLRVRVPVAVTLATTKQSVRRILELGPGAIIQFKKTCDETLTLEVAGRAVAEGEAVKVGDKFGLWITSMTLPKERYQKVCGKRLE